MIKNMNNLAPVMPHSGDAVWHDERVSVYESGRRGGAKTRKKDEMMRSNPMMLKERGDWDRHRK